ncbi:MAG TPA: DUF2807 domain-containing protein [Bacteroidia bacterium]|nr:DUF2807 domain-containing protein [Bacteroidia bacterium]
MKQVKLILAVLTGFLVPVFSQASGATKKITETRTSEAYHSIVVEGNAKITLVQDETPGLTVTGTEDQIMNMTTYLKNDTLYILQTNNHDVKGERTEITINVDNLTLLDVRGNTSVEAHGFINTDILSIKVDKGAVVNLDVRALKVKSAVLGSGSVELRGTTGSSFSNCEGCGSLDLHNLSILYKES